MTYSSLSTRNSALRPIIGNPQFEPGMRDKPFRDLSKAGMHQVSHINNMGRWKTVAELSDCGGLYRLDFMRALQLSHFLASLPPPNDTNQPLTTFEELCTETGVLSHTLSLTYDMLITPPGDYQPPSLIKWERDLNCHFTTNQKQNILRFMHKSSLCTKIQKTNYKLLTRWYRTPAQLHKFFPAMPDLCWWCQKGKRHPFACLLVLSLTSEFLGRGS